MKSWLPPQQTETPSSSSGWSGAETDATGPERWGNGAAADGCGFGTEGSSTPLLDTLGAGAPSVGGGCDWAADEDESGAAATPTHDELRERAMWDTSVRQAVNELGASLADRVLAAIDTSIAAITPETEPGPQFLPLDAEGTKEGLDLRPSLAEALGLPPGATANLHFSIPRVRLDVEEVEGGLWTRVTASVEDFASARLVSPFTEALGWFEQMAVTRFQASVGLGRVLSGPDTVEFSGPA